MQPKGYAHTELPPNAGWWWGDPVYIYFVARGKGRVGVGTGCASYAQLALLPRGGGGRAVGQEGVDCTYLVQDIRHPPPPTAPLHPFICLGMVHLVEFIAYRQLLPPYMHVCTSVFCSLLQLSPSLSGFTIQSRKEKNNSNTRILKIIQLFTVFKLLKFPIPIMS